MCNQRTAQRTCRPVTFLCPDVEWGPTPWFRPSHFSYPLGLRLAPALKCELQVLSYNSVVISIKDVRTPSGQEKLSSFSAGVCMCKRVLVLMPTWRPRVRRPWVAGWTRSDWKSPNASGVGPVILYQTQLLILVWARRRCVFISTHPTRDVLPSHLCPMMYICKVTFKAWVSIASNKVLDIAAEEAS